jgi:F-type H+-transporting ATPase subunit epsilon
MENNNQKKLKVKIITPQGITHQSLADIVVAPAVAGTVGILPHHIPFFTKLNPGEIKIKIDNKEEFFTVTGGFMDVNSDGLITILTDSAQRSEEITEAAAERAKLEAERALQQAEKLSKTEFARAESALRKAILELKISRRRRIERKPL